MIQAEKARPPPLDRGPIPSAFLSSCSFPSAPGPLSGVGRETYPRQWLLQSRGGGLFVFFFLKVNFQDPVQCCKFVALLP